jgi:hypothetical protein
VKKIQGDQRPRCSNKAVRRSRHCLILTTGIKGWNQKLYNDIASFAVSQGMDARCREHHRGREGHSADAHGLPQYDLGQQKVPTKNARKESRQEDRQDDSTPPSPRTAKTSEVNKAMSKLRESGSLDNAADAFLARMGGSDDE